MSELLDQSAASRTAQRTSASCTTSSCALGIAGDRRAGRVRRCSFARFFYLQVVQHDALPHAGRGEPHLDRADRAQPRHHRRPQRRGARAQLLGLHAGDHARARSTTSSARSTSSPTLVDITPRDRTPLQEAAGGEASASRACRSARASPTRRSRASPPTATAFPGVDINARLFRQYPHGELASHVIGHIGRINQQRPSTSSRSEGADAELPRHRLHRQGRPRGAATSSELHGTTGFEQVEIDAAGRAVRTLSRTPPSPATTSC